MIKKRGGVYHFKFRRNNQTFEGSCHTANKRTAEQIEAAHKANWALEKVGIGPKEKVPTFAEYATNVFLPDVRINKAAKPATITYYQNATAHLLKSPLATKRLDAITEADVTEHKGRMQKTGKYSVSTINGSLRALKRILNFACNADKIPKVCKITQLDGQNKREFVLTHEDEIEYLAASDELNRQVSTLMLEMGFRPEEIHELD